MSEEESEPVLSPIDMSEGAVATAWEERFETQINTFFDEAISRVPGFVDRHLRSFRRVMGRSLSPKTGIGDLLVGVRNVVSGVSKTVGGPDFSTTTYTHDKLTEDFEREVVSPDELETLLARLFEEFEDDMWENVADRAGAEAGREFTHEDIAVLRDHLVGRMEQEIAHDPLLAQAIRAGVKIGVPATLGYILFGKFSVGFTGIGAETAGKVYRKNLKFYNRILMKLGRFDMPNWIGAVGAAGGLVGTLAVGGAVEYAINSIRDVKGQYIRQLNTARYVLLYGEDPEDPEGRGLLHVVRGLERQFDRLPELTKELMEDESVEALTERLEEAEAKASKSKSASSD